MKFKIGDKVKVVVVVRDSAEVMGLVGTIRTTRENPDADHSYDYNVAFSRDHTNWGVMEGALRLATKEEKDLMGKVDCSICKDKILEVEAYSDRSSWICRKCYSTHKKCSHCGKWVTSESIKRTADGYMYCQECYEDDCWDCSQCGERYSGGNSQYRVHNGSDEDELCRSCYEERASECRGCHNLFYTGEMILDVEYDHWYCRRCDENRLHYKEVRVAILSTKTAGEYLKINRAIGVEIEAENGSPKYLRGLPSNCGVEKDGSLDSSGVEVQTPPATMMYAEKLIRETCEIMQKAGYMGTRHCGLHVHLDATDFRSHPIKLAHVLRTVYAVEDLLFSMMPPSRWGNSYCRKLSAHYKFDDFAGRMTEKKFESKWYRTVNYEDIDSWKRSKHDSPGTRYCALNLHSTMYRGTVEFRMHSGTVNAEKILRWTALLLNIVDYAVKRYDDKEIVALYTAPTTRAKLRVFFRAFKVSKELQTYVILRIKKFNPGFKWENSGKEEQDLEVEPKQMAFVSAS